MVVYFLPIRGNSTLRKNSRIQIHKNINHNKSHQHIMNHNIVQYIFVIHIKSYHYRNQKEIKHKNSKYNKIPSNSLATQRLKHREILNKVLYCITKRQRFLIPILYSIQRKGLLKFIHKLWKMDRLSFIK